MRLPSLSTGFLVFLLASIVFTSGEARLGPRSSSEDGTAMNMWRQQQQRRRMLEEQGVSIEEQKKQDEKSAADATNNNNNNDSPVEQKKDEQKKDEPKLDVVVAAADDQKKAEVKAEEKKGDDKKDETQTEEAVADAEKNTVLPELEADGGLSSGAVKGDDELKEEASKREEQLLKEALVLEREENRVQQEKNEQATTDGRQKQDSADPEAKQSPAPESQTPPTDDKAVDVKAEVKAEAEKEKESEKSETKEVVQEEKEAEKKDEEDLKQSEQKKVELHAEEEKKPEPEPEVVKVAEEVKSSSQTRKDEAKVEDKEDADEKETKEQDRQEEQTSVDSTPDPADTIDSADPDDDYPDFLDEFLRFPERLQQSAEHLKTNVPGWDRLSTNSKDLFNQANEQIKESFTPLIGRDYAPVVAYLVSYGLLLLPLGLVMFLFERVRAIFSLQKVLLFINIYVAAYFAALVAAAFILGSEPMDFFRNFSPSSYIFLQLLQAFGYIMFIILQTFDLITTCSSGRIAAKLSAALQWVVVVAVGFHYYVTVFHRAMAKAKPLTSWKIYGLYSASFTILCAFARIERGKKQYIIQESGQETTKQN
ncbi:hypothetical protein Mapa_008701 [Marchantia paleacea]|nr:hypothetical protein Mapa_008701 [Marchantia paleacea]